MKTLFLISALMFFLAKSIFASGDSVQQQFPITDPRNPDCVCRKYQEKAEKEYRQLLNKQAADEGIVAGTKHKSEKRPFRFIQKIKRVTSKKRKAKRTYDVNECWG